MAKKGRFSDLRISFASKKKVLVADAPHIDPWCPITAFLVQSEVFDVVAQQPTDVRPTGTAAEEVVFFVSFEVFDQGVLIDQRGISARGLDGLRVGYAGDGRPNATRGANVGSEAVVEEDPLGAKLLEKRGGIQRIAPHRAFVRAERFADHEHHIGGCRPRTRRHCALERQPGDIRIRHAQVGGHPRIVFAYAVGVETRPAETEGTEKGLDRIQRQVRAEIVAKIEGVTPTQGILPGPPIKRE